MPTSGLRHCPRTGLTCAERGRAVDVFSVLWAWALKPMALAGLGAEHELIRCVAGVAAYPAHPFSPLPSVHDFVGEVFPADRTL